MLKEFLINIKFDENIEQVFPIFEKILNGTKLVINVPKYNYFLKRIDNDLVHFTILYWYRTDIVKVTENNLKSSLYLVTYAAFKKINVPNNILTIKNENYIEIINFHNFHLNSLLC
jgi:hypothetical protein